MIRFVKGHCGWDTVTLVPEGDIPADRELDAALRIVSAPIDGGLEVGFMARGARSDQIVLRMVSSTAKDWIPMCGGMTQVIGKALVETFFREHFEVDVSRAVLERTLLTPSGAVPIRVSIRDGIAVRIATSMDDYAADLYRHGLEWLELEGVPVLRVGTYAVMRVDDLERCHPGVDFTVRRFAPGLTIVNELLRRFGALLGTSGVNGMLYDARPEGPGHYRVFPRFYSDDLSAARLPWEFQCGTGSIAVAIALLEAGLLRGAPHEETLLEWGSQRGTPDPYGIRLSRLALQSKGGRLLKATFEHSVVEILVEGKLTLPSYQRREDP